MIGFFAALVGVWGLVPGGDPHANGRSISIGLAWGLTIAIFGIAVVLIGAAALTGKFRSVTDLDRTVMALRGACAGVGRWTGGEETDSRDDECLLVETDDGGGLHFRVERQAAAIAEAAADEPVWACWRSSAPEPKIGQRTAAVLVGDSGWALQGEMWWDEALVLGKHQAQPVGSETVPVDEQRIVRLWNPASAWPLILSSPALVCVVVALAAAGACLTDFVEQWRWTFGVINNLALLSAVAMYVLVATKPAKDRARKSSRTVATGVMPG